MRIRNIGRGVFVEAWSTARYRSPLGYYEIAWHFDDAQQICLEYSVPFNAEATLVLADTEMQVVRINGASLQAAEIVAHNLERTLSAGHYRIEYPSNYKYLTQLFLENFIVFSASFAGGCFDSVHSAK